MLFVAALCALNFFRHNEIDTCFARGYRFRPFNCFMVYFCGCKCTKFYYMQSLGIRNKCVQLYSLQGGLCFYCQAKFQYQQLTRDHFLPRCKGGQSSGNVVLSCRDCNGEKSDKTLYEFREYQCRVLAEYLRCNKVLGKSNLQKGSLAKIKRHFAVIKRCTYLMHHPGKVDAVAHGYRQVNYEKALAALTRENKWVPYL